MQTLIICHSGPEKNSQKIAEAMAAELQAQVRQPFELQPQQLQAYDIIGFGSGIYFGSHHKTLMDFVDQLPVLGKRVFIFSTSGAGGTASHRSLRKKLTFRWCYVLGEFGCKGHDTFGPFKWFGGLNKGLPNDQDLEKARHFSRSLLEAVKKQPVQPQMT